MVMRITKQNKGQSVQDTTREGASQESGSKGWLPESLGLGDHSNESKFCSKMEIHWRVWCRDVPTLGLYFQNIPLAAV